MRQIQIVLICAAWLLSVSSMVTAQNVKETMTNADVVEMVKAGVAESNIVSKIQRSDPNFDISIKAVIELTKQGVSQKIIDAMLQPQIAAAKPETSRRADPGNAIAWKDIGPLRVVLKSVLAIKLDNGRMGIRLSFEFINLETQKPIVVALNAIAQHGNLTNYYLRSTLVDENGELWRLHNPDVAGMGIVGVGQQGYVVSEPLYNPTEIVALLSKRDDLKSDVVTNSGYQNRFIYGSMTEMPPGQSLTVTMNFVQDNNQQRSGTPPRVFQLATEIVVGVLASGSKKSYTLYNLMFDRVSPR